MLTGSKVRLGRPDNERILDDWGRPVGNHRNASDPAVPRPWVDWHWHSVQVVPDEVEYVTNE